MKKNNTKVELKKYLSQKEKIKNTFISSCIILVVLTFFIFITYSYFIEDSGEIDVGNVQASVTNVEIYSKEIVENTNNQKAIITIVNNSSENYSYNLNYQENESCYEVYYDITSEEYSHPKGIITPYSEKKIYLISNLDCDVNSLNLKVDSGYEYSPIKISDGYNEINYYLYSSMQHKTDLIDLWPDYGELSPRFETGIYKYDMYINKDEIESLGGWINEVTFNPYFSNGGYITGEKVQITEEGTIKHKIKVYAEDGTYVTTYIINIHVIEFGTGKIKSFKLVDSYRNDRVVATASKENGFEYGETVNFKIVDDYYNSGDPGQVALDLYFVPLDGDYSNSNVKLLKYHNPGYDFYAESSGSDHLHVNDLRNIGNAMINFGNSYIVVSTQDNVYALYYGITI